MYNDSHPHQEEYDQGYWDALDTAIMIVEKYSNDTNIINALYEEQNG